MSKYQEIKQLCQRATPAPWSITPITQAPETFFRITANYPGKLIRSVQLVLGCPDLESDAEFIANARTDIPLLLKALELACKQLHDLDADNLFGDSVKPEYWLDVAQADY